MKTENGPSSQFPVPSSHEPPYSPYLRTALVLTGSGTAGAYHAGVLWALHEAGVKIDLMAGCGMGVVGAMFAAVDGGARLWDANGPWRGADGTRLYRWRTTLRTAAWTLAAALTLLLIPLAALIVGALVYPVAFLLRLLGVEAGTALASGYARLLDVIFDPAVLPTFLPRVVVLALAMLLGTLIVGAVASSLRARVRRRMCGPLWWRMLGAPLDVSRATERFAEALWQLIRGAAQLARPSLKDWGRAYSELLTDNLGQPGFRELIVTAHDVDARRDLIFALLSEPHRRRVFLPRPDRWVGERSLEMVDLAGASGEHAADAFVAALSLPVATEPHLISFAPESPWCGEVHRVCGRPDALGRLLEEVASAGAEQVVVVSATAAVVGPHTLSATRRDARGRAGEHLAAIEATAVRDAISSRGDHFRALFPIRPHHNPVGPLDFGGCYDERSDREQTVAELVNRGYEDAYRSFIDPVVGASGERLERTRPDGSL